REVDAGDEREAAQDASAAGDRERVLVVQARVRDADDDIARCQVVQGELDGACVHAPVLIERTKRTKRHTRRLYASSAQAPRMRLLAPRTAAPDASSSGVAPDPIRRSRSRISAAEAGPDPPARSRPGAGGT